MGQNLDADLAANPGEEGNMQQRGRLQSWTVCHGMETLLRRNAVDLIPPIYPTIITTTTAAGASLHQADGTRLPAVSSRPALGEPFPQNERVVSRLPGAATRRRVFPPDRLPD